MKKILLITSYDSFFKSGLLVAQNINNSVIDIFVHDDKRDLGFSKNQLSELGVNKNDITNFHIDHYFENKMYYNYDIVVLSVGNSLLNRFYKLQYKIYREQFNTIKAPILITLFPGVIFGDRASILSRMLSDIVLYLCPYDFEQGELIKNKFGFQCTNILYGFSRYSQRNKEDDSTKKIIYFIDQVIIPFTKADRLTIIKKLIVLAEENPLEKIIILPRVEKGERTVHDDPYPYRELIKGLNVPSNLIVKRIPITTALSNMKICLSMSSTVIFEAIALDIPVYIIKDFGVRDKFANSIFVESGVMGNLLDLNVNAPPKLNNIWKKKYYCCLDQAHYLNLAIIQHNFVAHSYDVYKKQMDKLISFPSRLLRKTLKLIKHPKLFFRDSLCWARLKK